MSVEYNREQAEQVLKDKNRFYDTPVVLYEGDKKFLNHKFPPKIEYVGKAWKHRDEFIFLCTSKDKDSNLYGYGWSDILGWFNAQKDEFVADKSDKLQITEATPTEWMAALEKCAESKYNEGDEVKCLSLNNPNEKIASFNHALNELNCLNEGWATDEWWATAEDGVALLMKDGIWTDIITPAKENPYDKFRAEFKKLEKEINDLENKEKNKTNRKKFTDKVEELYKKNEEFKEHVLGFNPNYPKKTPIIERDEYGAPCIIGYKHH